MVCGVWGDVLNDVVLVDTGSGVSDLFEEDDQLHMGDILLSSNVDVHASLGVYFMAIKMLHWELNLAVSDKAGDVLVLTVGGLDA